MKRSSKITAMFAAVVMAATAVPAAAFAQDAQAVTAEVDVPGAKKDISECYVEDIGDWGFQNDNVEPPYIRVWSSNPRDENGEATDAIFLISNVDYTLSYKNNDKIGTATVVIKGIGDYSGTKEVDFNIVPWGPGNITASLKKGKVTVKWSKVDEATKYFVYYSENGGPLKKLGTTKKTKFSTSKLDTEHNSYNFYVASVTVVDGKNYASVPACDEGNDYGSTSIVVKTGKSEFDDIVMTVSDDKITIKGFDFKKYMKMASKKDPIHVEFGMVNNQNRELPTFCVILNSKTITGCKNGYWDDDALTDVKFKWSKSKNTLTLYTDTSTIKDQEEIKMLTVSAHNQSKCNGVGSYHNEDLFYVNNSEYIYWGWAHADMKLIIK